MLDMKTPQDIGLEMRQLRQKNWHWPVAAVIAKIGCSRATLNNLERGLFSLDRVSLWQLLRLERVYGPALGLRQAIEEAETEAHKTRGPAIDR